jgi:sentrin-specific protease 1
MKRTLDNAKATLNSPRPSVPFIPSDELRKRSDRKKDADIEKRLRGLPDSLPGKEDDEVSAILRKRGVVAKFAREQVSDVDISRLKPGQWLNDEIINFYGAMILARSESNKENAQVNGKAGGSVSLDVHYFSSFFWAKLTKEGYQQGRLAKWTKKARRQTIEFSVKLTFVR